MATKTEPRLPLSRDRIVHAALELADEGGIESLVMRKLGQVLGFEAMSLYNHVANKDDVLDGILDPRPGRKRAAFAGRRLGRGNPNKRDLRPRGSPASPLVVHPADGARTLPPGT